MSRLNKLLATTLGLALLGAAPVLADPGKGNGHGKNMQHGNQGHQNPGGGNDWRGGPQIDIGAFGSSSTIIAATGAREQTCRLACGRIWHAASRFRQASPRSSMGA